MDEIYYIVGIDARPWKRSETIGAIIRIVLFFASIEAFRKTLNLNQPLRGAQRYFVIILLVVTGIYLSKWIKRPWREEYTKKLLLNLIYLGLIATGFSNALFYLANIQTDLAPEVSANTQTIALTRFENYFIKRLNGPTYFYIIFVAVICGVGVLYMALQTGIRVRAETVSFANRPSSHIYQNFFARQKRSLGRFI
jgi:hypothetical protein